MSDVDSAVQSAFEKIKATVASGRAPKPRLRVPDFGDLDNAEDRLCMAMACLIVGTDRETRDAVAALSARVARLEQALNLKGP